MLVRAVEAFLKQHDMAATKFGRLAAGDPRFVLDLRLGRIPRAKTEARTRGWMAEYEVAAKKAARANGRPYPAPCPAPAIPAPRPAPEFKAIIKEIAHV